MASVEQNSPTNLPPKDGKKSVESPSRPSFFEDAQEGSTSRDMALVKALLELDAHMGTQATHEAGDELRELKSALSAREQPAEPPYRRLSWAVGSCVDRLLDTATVAARAQAAWHKVAGAVASKHTRGIFYQEKKDGKAGVLYVFVDSPVFIYEFTTDHELYEQRMAFLGWDVDHIEFKLSRYPAKPGAWGETAPARPVDLSAAPLSPELETWCKKAVSSLDEDLAHAVYKAMSTSLQRDLSSKV